MKKWQALKKESTADEQYLKVMRDKSGPAVDLSVWDHLEK